MVIRVTLSLDPIDVDLVDRLATLTGSNRSEQIRQFLGEARPVLRQTVEILESALRQRDQLSAVFSEAQIAGFSALLPEIERVQDAVVGSMSRIEGALAAHEAADPRLSNHGGHTPNPPSTSTTE